MVGTILADYQPKWICMTLKQSKFHDFGRINIQDLGLFRKKWTSYESWGQTHRLKMITY